MPQTVESILYNRQHGFRKGLGCETQLCATYHDLARSIEQGSTVHGVILDFLKAFGKAPHNLLMQKIWRIDNINLNIVNRIQSFLAQRSQRVAVRGTLSSGVPQGSVLGPTLILIYINDFPKVVTRGVSLYADDTLLYSELNNDGDRLRFQASINALHK